MFAFIGSYVSVDMYVQTTVSLLRPTAELKLPSTPKKYDHVVFLDHHVVCCSANNTGTSTYIAHQVNHEKRERFLIVYLYRD